jgi:hypothetical protein
MEQPHHAQTETQIQGRQEPMVGKGEVERIAAGIRLAVR